MNKVLLVLVLVLVIALAVVGNGIVGATPAAPLSNGLAGLAAASPSASTPAATPQYGGTLRLVRERLPTSTIGWPAGMLSQDTEFMVPCIENLLHSDTNGTPLPWLATAWEVSPDRTSLTLTLRQGVKFHDGTDFNAAAVKYNLDAVKDAGTPGTTYWTSIEVIDDHTVKINFSQWENLIFANLAARAGMMISPTAAQKDLEYAKTHPVGTGPFTFVNLTRDVSLEFKRFDNYWQKGAPYLDGIQMILIPDAVTQVNTYKTGEAEVVSAWSATELSDLKTAGATLAYRHDGVFILYPDDANADSPYSNPLVRQAVEYAIDKESLMAATGAGIFEAAYQAPTPGSIGYLSNITPRKYDPAKAKQLLAEAGYPNGFDTTIAITIPAPDIKDTQVALGNYLSAVGIKCTLEYADPAKYADYISQGWHNTLIFSPVNAEGNFLGTVQAYYTVPDYYVSLKGPDGLMDLYTQALTTVNVDRTKVEAVSQSMFDADSLIPVSYMGTGLAYNASKVHDTGFLQFSSHTMWRPDTIWMSK